MLTAQLGMAWVVWVCDRAWRMTFDDLEAVGRRFDLSARRVTDAVTPYAASERLERRVRQPDPVQQFPYVERSIGNPPAAPATGSPSCPCGRSLRARGHRAALLPTAEFVADAASGLECEALDPADR